LPGFKNDPPKEWAFVRGPEQRLSEALAAQFDAATAVFVLADYLDSRITADAKLSVSISGLHRACCIAAGKLEGPARAAIGELANALDAHERKPTGVAPCPFCRSGRIPETVGGIESEFRCQCCDGSGVIKTFALNEVEKSTLDALERELDERKGGDASAGDTPKSGLVTSGADSTSAKPERELTEEVAFLRLRCTTLERKHQEELAAHQAWETACANEERAHRLTLNHAAELEAQLQSAISERDSYRARAVTAELKTP